MNGNRDITDAPMHNPETDYIYSEGAYFPPQFRIVGFFLLLAGITLCLQLSFPGLILIAAGFVVVFARKELTVSFSLSKYRYTISLFKFRYGKWTSFPEFESISIFSANKSQQMSAGSQSGTAVYKELEVNLIYNGSRRLTVYTGKNFEKCLQVARQFAGKLDLAIYDATKREGEWIS